MKKKIKNSPQKHIHSSSRKAWLTAIGGILMFVSWTSENIYLSDINSAKEQIRGDAQFITSESSNSLQWMLKYQEEIKKPNYDIDTIANSSRGYFVAMNKILEAAARIDPNSDIFQGHLKEYLKYKDKYMESFKIKDVDSMTSITSEVMHWMRTIYPEAEKEANRVAFEISKKGNFYKGIFRFAHIFSSMFFGVAWIYENRKNKHLTKQSS